MSGDGLSARDVCLLLVLDVIDLVEDEELGLRSAVREVVRRCEADGRPLGRDATLWMVAYVQRARDDWGWTPEEAAVALYLEGLAAV